MSKIILIDDCLNEECEYNDNEGCFNRHLEIVNFCPEWIEKPLEELHE